MVYDIFQDTISKTNELINVIAEKLGMNKHHACRTMRVVLHTLRDRLPLDEAVNLSAQLPILMKGVYFDGWDPSLVPIKYNKDQFIDFISLQLPSGYSDRTEEIIKLVLDTIFEQMNPHEIDKIKKVLPDYLKVLF